LSHKIRGFDSEKRRLMVDIISLAPALRLTGAQERVTAAVEKRLTAQNALTHYEKKLTEENQKLERAKEDANVCETEFQVRDARAGRRQHC
jgi:hypothetical protein